jgi:hypothetical protein
MKKREKMKEKAVFGSGSRSGSGRIRVILPDLDRYQFITNEKVDKLNFFQKIQYDAKYTENYDIIDTDKKNKSLINRCADQPYIFLGQW